jgi:hypothetical protein
MREKNYIPEVCHSLLVSRLIRRFYIHEESINSTHHSTSRTMSCRHTAAAFSPCLFGHSLGMKLKAFFVTTL